MIILLHNHRSELIYILINKALYLIGPTLTCWNCVLDKNNILNCVAENNSNIYAKIEFLKACIGIRIDCVPHSEGKFGDKKRSQSFVMLNIIIMISFVVLDINNNKTSTEYYCIRDGPDFTTKCHSDAIHISNVIGNTTLCAPANMNSSPTSIHTPNLIGILLLGLTSVYPKAPCCV